MSLVLLWTWAAVYVWITVNFWLIQTGDLTFTICFSMRFHYRVVLFEDEFVHIIRWAFVMPLLLHGCDNSIILVLLRVNAKGLRETFSLSQFGIAFLRNGLFFSLFSRLVWTIFFRSIRIWQQKQKKKMRHKPNAVADKSTERLKNPQTERKTQVLCRLIG